MSGPCLCAWCMWRTQHQGRYQVWLWEQEQVPQVEVQVLVVLVLVLVLVPVLVPVLLLLVLVMGPLHLAQRSRVAAHQAALMLVVAGVRSQELAQLPLSTCRCCCNAWQMQAQIGWRKLHQAWLPLLGSSQWC